MQKRENKILAILPSKVLYGKERSNIEVYNLLAEDGRDISVVVNKHSDKKIFDYLANFKTYPMSFANRHHKNFRYVRYIWGLIYSNISLLLIIMKVRPQVLFLCSELSFYDHYLPIALSGAKIIYRIGDEPAFPKLSNYKYNSRVWYKFVCKKVDTFVCISEYIKRTVEKVGRINSNDTVIYNYPPRRKKSTVDESFKYSIFDKDVIKFGYIGQLVPQKGVDHYLMAAREILEKYKNVVFYVAGSLQYDKEFSDKLLDIQQSVPGKDRIIFLDEIDDIEKFFTNIDILCVPSIKEEPLGNVLVEAKEYATPCIIFRSGGMPELITHKENGYICPTSDSKGLVEAMQYYISNQNLISLHNDRSQASIAELKIDYKSFHKKWLDVLNRTYVEKR